MFEITDKEKCCGCTACYSICPQGCIKMIPDFEGFIYPLVDMKTCVQCGMCKAVCPIENSVCYASFDRKAYAIRSKKGDVLMESTSGGFFTPLATYLLDIGWTICAATYDEDFTVKHTLVSLDNGERYSLKRFKGSKYVQSDLNNCFQLIEHQLCERKSVCFIGTTCQVSGLKSYLRKEYENLLTVDLVCHGTPSPKLWRKYIEFQTEKYGSSIANVSFRNKTYGYHSGTMKIEFSNGEIYYGSARIDHMLKSFFNEIASRPICYKCPFKQLERCSDFTIYDCWHISDLVAGLKDDDCGYTNLIVQSQKGAEIFETIKELYRYYDVDINRAVELDGSMVMRSAVPHPRRPEFYKKLDDNDLDKHIQKYIPINKLDYALENMKGLLYKMGVLKILKKLLK